jgi:hypothetical protein
MRVSGVVVVVVANGERRAKPEPGHEWYWYRGIVLRTYSALPPPLSRRATAT